MNQYQDVSNKLLAIDLEQETEKICSRIRDLLKNRLKRRGMVVGVSGGIDSSVTAAHSTATHRVRLRNAGPAPRPSGPAFSSSPVS